MATLPARRRAELLARADTLLRDHGVRELRHDLRTQIWTARPRGAPLAHDATPRVAAT